jgi:hypothetical protein
MYGTWNRLNAVAARMNPVSTQAADSASGSPGGTAKVSTKNTGSRMAPITMKRLREPVRARLRSLRAPIQGSMMTSQIFETVKAAPANAGFTPRVLVM